MKTYNFEDKIKAVEYALAAPSISAASETLKIPRSTLHTWVKDYRLLGLDNTQASKMAQMEARLNASIQQIERLELENQILKKYRAFLSTPQNLDTNS